MWKKKCIPWSVIHEIAVIEIDLGHHAQRLEERVCFRIGGWLNPPIERLGLLAIQNNGRDMNACLRERYGQDPAVLAARMEAAKEKARNAPTISI